MTSATGSPADTFAAAQRAMVAGDWETFFRTVATKDLRRLAAMGLGVAIGPHADAAAEQLAVHGIDADTLAPLRDIAAQLTASAAAVGGEVTPEEQHARSLAHRDLVKALETTTRDIAAHAPDLPGLVAAIERFRRATESGGSVSSRLFLDETLTDVVVSGIKATAMRRYPNGTADPVRFVVERGEWRVSIFGR